MERARRARRTGRTGNILTSALTAALLAAVAAATAVAQERPAPRRTAQQARGWIGIVYALQAAPPHLKGAPGDSTILVIEDVQKKSPAARAGLQAGDTVLRINGEAVTAAGMRRFGETLRPGDRVRFTVRRGGRTQDVPVLAERRSELVFLYPYRGAEHTIVINLDSVRGAILRSLDSVRASLEGVRLHIDSVAPAARRAADAARLSLLYVDSLMPQLELQIRRWPEEQARLDSAMAELRRREWLRVEDLRRMRLAADSIAAEARRAQNEMARVQAAELRRQRLLADSVLRAAERARAEARLLELPPAFAPFVLGERVVAGAQFTALNPELGDYFGVAQGVLVTEVLRGTPAADAGLAAGDVITAAADRPVASIPELRAALARAERPTTITVVRKRRTLQLKLPE